MAFLRILLIVTAFLGLASCGGKFRTYNGPEITSIQVHKADRKMYLLHKKKVVKTYDIGLGGNPVGHKQFEGDMKTPEGSYTITHRNPNSKYYLSLGISYPNAADRAYAAEQGKEPGGDIFIHGAPPKAVRHSVRTNDWTAGCIAVTDDEIEMIYAMVKPGTPIHIFP
ncbi:L,D-transpeptidase family protein [Paracoccaceae bacterium]